tara:strand:- start:272 stop:1513 length:1242 start_codon:yes stop_codon:yes gene_type:complete
MGAAISDIFARAIIDSRGNPTLEVECYVDGILKGRASVPSGASTGTHEAVELRDGGEQWMGKGVQQAINNVNGPIREALVGINPENQSEIDNILIKLDDSENKRNLGANATLGASLSCLRASSHGNLWKRISQDREPSLPVPMMNILNGGAHAETNVDVQEFMIVPHGFDDFSEALRSGVEIYHALKSTLKQEGLLGGVGDEGGFAPNLSRNEEGLRLVNKAIVRAGYSPGKQVSIALDVAAQEFLDGTNYQFDGNRISGEELGKIYSKWLDDYPIVSIEDPFGEDDWDSWVEFTSREGHRVQIVGDDLYVTNLHRLEKGIAIGASNAILIKLNQIGTYSETMGVIEKSRESGLGTIISHRSGETSDDLIADLAVGTNSMQIKTGAPARSDRTSKYNQLLRISEKVRKYSNLF